uniref:Replication-associated protein n=1 Tax=Genomoviridae sp. TaxID=2202565 RepID=A0A858NEX5_9VIRU|nr:MAG: replication-associated protein [Genomoviridae sp.]
MPFAFSAKYALLTYPQCGDLSPHRVVELLAKLGGSCIVGRENHKDGGIHLHVFVDFGRKFRSRKANIFDVDNRHPNIAPSRGTPEKGYDYAVKDGDIVAGDLKRPEPRRVGDGSTVEKWTSITNAENREEFWELVHRMDPKSAACSFSQLSKYADWKFAIDPPDYEHPTGVEFFGGDVDGRHDWLQQSGIGSKEPLVGRCRSLCIYGATRVGKTMWARSLGDHVYCVGLISGTECMKGSKAQYAVFDDIRGGIKFFPSYKEWLGCQQWVTVKCLYKEPQLVHWGKPGIWLSNTDPRLEMLQADIDWMEGNVDFIEINEPIFRASK